MLQLDELRLQLISLKPALHELSEAINYEETNREIEQLDASTAREGFWDDIEEKQKVFTRSKQLKTKVDQYDALRSLFDDTMTMLEIAQEEQDEVHIKEIVDMAERFTLQLDEMKLATLLTGEYDSKNAILTFHAGAGGTEAQDWAQMLYRMYTRWAERHNFQYKILDYLDGDEAGLKSASILIEGLNAYGYLKSESGVHRLVRISPFDASGRRHTSFASLEVMPEIDDSVHIDIKDEDLKVDT